MKLLQVGYSHPRNSEFIKRACQLFDMEYHYTDSTNFPNNNWDIIWSPTQFINPDVYPTSKFIFGPQFWVFPTASNSLFTQLKPEHRSRCIYVCLSDWISTLYQEFVDISNANIAFVPLPFGVEDIAPKTTTEYTYDCIVYFKARHPSILDFCVSALNKQGLTYKVFQYGSYDRSDYIQTLKQVRFAVWIGSHESQGFAFQECLATNTPVYVYDVKTMKDEFNNNFTYAHHKEQLVATSAPYWDSTCGYKVYSNEEFVSALPTFIDALPTFNPASYVQKTLTDRVCFQRFLDALSLKI